MGRPYCNSGFQTSQTIVLPATGSLAGTAAISAKSATKFMTPVRITGMNVYFVAGGTSTAQSFVIGKSLAGTGAFSGIGTIVVGTQATGTFKSGTVTETSMAVGDALILQAGGTSAVVANGQVSVLFREEFVNA